MVAEYYTPEQIAEKIAVSPSKVIGLINRKLLGCAFVGRSRRISEAHLLEYMKHVASRAPRKNRKRPPIPENLDPVWQRLVEIALKNYPLLAQSMQEATLASIDTKTRIAAITTASEEAASEIMADKNRYAIQRSLQTIFQRPLLVRATCSKSGQTFYKANETKEMTKDDKNTPGKPQKTLENGQKRHSLSL